MLQTTTNMNIFGKYYYWVGGGCSGWSRLCFLTGGIDAGFIDSKEPKKTCWITGNFAKTWYLKNYYLFIILLNLWRIVNNNIYLGFVHFDKATIYFDPWRYCANIP